MEKKNLWEKYVNNREEIEQFASGYKEFLSNNKTERECITWAVGLAQKHGFKNLDDVIASGTKLRAGDKVYAVNMNKAIVLSVIGTEPIQNGLNIVGAHVDSPRLDLKASPLFESHGFCLLDTHYYGGIKKYQWTTLPLAIHGVVFKTDGTKQEIVLGEKETDPVLVISDLLPHLESRDKTTVIKGEDLNLLAGNIPSLNATKDKFKANILSLLKLRGISEEDLFSAELEVVPAGKARDCGLDSSMILGYGHDDRVCAYTGLSALFETQHPTRTVVNILVDKEEIGSVGATGMESRFFENTIAELLNACGEYSDLALRRTLQKSNMISSDVTAGVDPIYTEPYNDATDAHLSHGISFNKFTGSRGKSGANDANPEFIARLRKVLDDAGVDYQATEMGKVDQGGGGTIAYIMAKYDMNVIDGGVPVLNMHSPWEVVSKIDVYETYRCYKEFYKMM